MSHAALGPSAAGRWIHCPGSVSLTLEHGTDTTTAAASEGIQAHEYAARWISTQQRPDDMPEDMAAAVELYVNDVGKGAVTEQLIPITAIHPQCYGTPDAHRRQGNHLIVWDLKYGFAPVEARENWQLLCYAAGLARPGDTIELRISQPRIRRRVLSWSITWDQLTGYIDLLREAAAIALSGQSFTIPGKHCLYCPAMHVCAAGRRVALSLSEYLQNTETEPVPDNDLAGELIRLQETAKVISARVHAIESAILTALAEGRPVSGVHIKHKPGRLEWTAPEAELRMLETVLGVNLSKLVTPTQAINRGLSPDVIQHYSTRTNSALVIDTECDTRAKEIFKK